MANIISVPVYQINSNQQFGSVQTIGIGVQQIRDVKPLSGNPATVLGNYVYTCIETAGSVQNPGNTYYTPTSVANIITAANA